LSNTAACVHDIKQALGPRGWLEGADMAPHLTDFFRRTQGNALLVARPDNTEQVQAVVRICGRYGIAIVPQGGNTGLCGGAIPGPEHASIVLSLARMNRILAVDPDCYTITAEAGCILQNLHDAAAAADRAFAMDWGARGTATVGGGISTNAGGINVLRYGNTREQVLGLEAVLPDGRVWNGLRALRKDSSGYDLKHLFIGGEGTLGVVTKAVLKLYPRPAHTQTLFGAVAELERVIQLFVLARDMAGPVLSAFELIPGSTFELALKKTPTLQRPIETRSDWYVLVRASDRVPVTATLETFFERAAEAGLLTDGALAQSTAQEANLWTLRDEIPPGQVMTGKMLKWDASVPIDRIIPFLREVERTAEAMQPGTQAIAFGHVGDGNLHLSVFPRQEGDWQALFERMERAIDGLIWQYNGSICAEHGIGQLNHRRIAGQKPAIELEMMARIRELFDPEGIFNPGKAVDASLLRS
jgi:FAD/FMN-containing dehydrogenase